MALTVAVTEKTVMGNKRVHRGTIAFDSSYPTGGESFTAANMGLGAIDEVTFQSTSGHAYEYDYTNNKVLCYAVGITTGATAAGGTTGTFVTDSAGSETTWRAQSVGVSTTVVAGPLKEVANTTDLSGVTGVRWMAIGR